MDRSDRQLSDESGDTLTRGLSAIGATKFCGSRGIASFSGLRKSYLVSYTAITILSIAPPINTYQDPRSYSSNPVTA